MAQTRAAPKKTTARRPPPKGRHRRREPAKALLESISPIGSADWAVAGCVALATAIVFATTFSSHVALGDAPETVTGVKSLGILHSPGYASYVVAARLFGEVARFGTWSFRVNLFSALCASVAIGLLFVLCRGLGAGRGGGVIGAGALAVSASYWFDAGFAKHFAFTGLLYVGAALCTVLYQQRRRGWLLVVAGALLGLGLGAGWQLLLLLAAGLVVNLAIQQPRPPLRTAIAALATGAVCAIGVAVYVLVRASHDPVINYADPRTIGRLFELFSGSDLPTNTGGAASGSAHAAGAIAVNLGNVARDLGLGVLALAVLGIVELGRRRSLAVGLFLATVGIGNLLAIGVFTGSDQIGGFYTVVAQGGHLIGAAVAVVVLAALGTTWLVAIVRGWAAKRSVSVSLATGSVIALCALITIGPSLVVHYRPANHRMPPLADQYASAVLSSLPRNSAFVTGAWEWAQPLVYRQTVAGDRSDVDVISADSLTKKWYRNEVTRRFGIDAHLDGVPTNQLLLTALTRMRANHRVFVDTYTAQYLGNQVGYTCSGLVCEIVDGEGPHPVANLAATAGALDQEESREGALGNQHGEFPNYIYYVFHERAHIELAKEYAEQNNLAAAADELERAFVFNPVPQNQEVIDAVRAHQQNAKQIVLSL